MALQQDTVVGQLDHASGELRIPLAPLLKPYQDALRSTLAIIDSQSLGAHFPRELLAQLSDLAAGKAPNLIASPVPPSLLTLPHDVLLAIINATGAPHHVRPVCRALRDALPPCPTLQVSGPYNDLLPAFTTPSTRLAAAATSLTLRIASFPHDDVHLHDLLEALPDAFPRLRALALHLPPGYKYSDRDLALLAFPHPAPLTSLALSTTAACLPPLPALPSFTALHTLAIRTSTTRRAIVRGWLAALGHLPHLRDLSISVDKFDNEWERNCDNSWVAQLPPAAPHLTALTLGTLHGWDVDLDAALLPARLTALRRLSLTLKPTRRDWTPPTQLPVCAGLLAPHELPLPDLHLRLDIFNVTDRHWRNPYDPLPELPPGLQLASLHITSRPELTEQDWAVKVRPLLGSQTALTRLWLAMDPPRQDPRRLYPLLSGVELSALAGTLRELRVGCYDLVGPLVPVLPCLTALQDLRVVACWNYFRRGQQPTAPDWAPLAGLRGLTRLAVEAHGTAGSSVLQHVAGMTRLRSLALYHKDDQGTTGYGGEDLLHLLPLRRSLTRLVLKCSGSLTGPQLSTLRLLTALQELQVPMPEAGPGEQLPEVLLPLPGRLSLLCVRDIGAFTNVRGVGRAAKMTRKVRERLQAETRGLGCRFFTSYQPDICTASEVWDDA